jgi:hypothetical protein
VKRGIFVAPFEELADPRVAGEISESRPAGDPFDVVVEVGLDDDPARWERAGATWTVTEFGRQPTRARVSAVIDAGPR